MSPRYSPWILKANHCGWKILQDSPRFLIIFKVIKALITIWVYSQKKCIFKNQKCNCLLGISVRSSNFGIHRPNSINLDLIYVHRNQRHLYELISFSSFWTSGNIISVLHNTAWSAPPLALINQEMFFVGSTFVQINQYQLRIIKLPTGTCLWWYYKLSRNPCIEVKCNYSN